MVIRCGMLGLSYKRKMFYLQVTLVCVEDEWRLLIKLPHQF